METAIKRYIAKLRRRLFTRGDCTDLQIEYACIFADLYGMDFYYVVDWFNYLLKG